jgi:Na+/H+-dicarboxylate symporter
MVMLVIVLRSVGVPAEGIAMILAVDRVLDMCRTVVNVTGDAAVAVAVAGWENRLNRNPNPNGETISPADQLAREHNTEAPE